MLRRWAESLIDERKQRNQDGRDQANAPWEEHQDAEDQG